MRDSELKKNKSKIGKWQLFFLLALLLLALGLRVQSFFWNKTEIGIGDVKLQVLVADNYRHWTRGLSKRSDLGKYDGMLFVFNNRAAHTMVMRDMEFAIDIIWIDKDTIIDIAPYVAVEPTGARDGYFPYVARGLSTHVLEVRAGMAQERHWKIGDKVEFNP